MGYGKWDMGHRDGIWDIGYGDMGYVTWYRGHWVWDMGYGIWNMGYGIWYIGRGTYDIGHGVWGMGYGVCWRLVPVTGFIPVYDSNESKSFGLSYSG
jgi:hypothetical protein